MVIAGGMTLSEKTRAFFPDPLVGGPRKKIPTSGKPEIGAQFGLWIFSYAIFKTLPRVMLSQPTISRVLVRRREHDPVASSALRHARVHRQFANVARPSFDRVQVTKRL